MKTIGLGFLLSVLAVLAGCAGTSTGNEVKLGEEFTLSIGQTVSITEEDLSISFVDVTEDSRCPANVTCVWEGRANIAVRLFSQDKEYDLNLIEPGLTQQSEDTFLDYNIIYNLEPYPQEGVEILESDYRLHLTVSIQEELSPAAGKLAEIRKLVSSRLHGAVYDIPDYAN